MANKYIIWKRNDGYIDASANHMPLDYVTGGSEIPKDSPVGTVRPGSGIPVTFEFLAEFPEWHAAYDFIVKARQDCTWRYREASIVAA